MSLLAGFHGDQRLYLLLLPAVIGLALIQIGGYTPEKRDAMAVDEAPS